MNMQKKHQGLISSECQSQSKSQIFLSHKTDELNVITANVGRCLVNILGLWETS